MSTSKSYYRITETGVESVQETVTECQIADDVMQRYSTEKVVKVPNLFNGALIGDGVPFPVALTVKGGIHCFTLRLGHFPIQSKFVMKDGLMMPDFAAATATSTVFKMIWPVPDDMRLYLVYQIDPGLAALDGWLTAYDASGKCWRLPLSNCYEDGRLCQGKYDVYGSSMMECLIKAYTQFLNSPFNWDLSDRGGSDGMQNSMSLFRFKPLEPDGFEAVKPEKAWTTYCTRISKEFLVQNTVII